MRYQSPNRFESIRFKNLRSKFSIPSLLLAGAVSLANLSAVRDASALSGAFTSSATPRENSGAAGGVTLIPSAASASTSTPPDTSSAVTQRNEPSEPGERASGRTRRREQVEEGGTRRRRNQNNTGATDRTKTRERRASVASKESKDSKQVTPVSIAPPRVNFTLSSGFETRYIYHGLDIISFDSKLGTVDDYFKDKTHSSGIYYENADVTYAGFHLGVSYVRATSPTYPYYQTPKLQDFFTILAVTRSEINQYQAPFTNSTAVNRRRFFQETDVNLDYSLSVIGGWLDATAGYDSFFFPDRDFRGISYQGNLFTRLAFTRFQKFVTPSFNYFHYFSKDVSTTSLLGNTAYFDKTNANGNYVEFRLDSNFVLIDRPSFGLAIAPYAAFGFNINYLENSRQKLIIDPTTGVASYGGNFTSDNGGWNDIELGVKLSARIGKHLTVTPYGNYGLNIGSEASSGVNSFGADRTLQGSGVYGERTSWWGGVTVAYTF